MLSGGAHWPKPLGLSICGVNGFVSLFTWPRLPSSAAFQRSPPSLLLLATVPASALLPVALFVVSVRPSLWRPSSVTETQLERLDAEGSIPPKDVAHWRAPPSGEASPHPRPDEVVTFRIFYA